MGDSEKFNPEAGISYEASKKEMYEKSNKRAWTVAIISVIITFLLAVAIIILLPLKTVIPFVINKDSNGMLQVVNQINHENITTSEAEDKFWVNLYVKKREGYYYNMLQSDYEYVQILSMPRVAKEYVKIYSGKNPRDKKLGSNNEVRVKVNSIVLGESAGSKIATVRAEIIERNLQSNTVDKKTTKVFTVNYKYFPEIEQKEENRLRNPLGFKVETYRTDYEVN